jgi:hypothetical protein
MDAKTYHLEAFSSPIKGRRIWISAHPTVAAGRFAAVEAELGHRARHIVVMASAGVKALPKWAEAVRVDILFRVVDSVDLKLLIQAIQTKPVPTICLWFGPAPPAAVFQYFQRLLFVTLLVSGEGAPIEDYDAVFWPSGGAQEEVESILIRKMGSAKATEVAVGTIMKELTASNVGLVWSCIEESDKNGCVYWFDPFEFELGEGKSSIQDLFEQMRYATDKLEKLIGGR